MECNHQRYYNNELECLVKRRPQGVIRCANSSTCEDSSMSIPTGSLDACSCSSPLQPPKSSQHSKHPRLAKDYWTACLLSLVVLLGGSISLPGNQTSRLDTVVPVDLRSYARLQTNPKFLHTTIFDVPLLPTYLEMPNMEPLKRSMFPHYNDLVFESLVLVPEHRFQRVIDPDERKIVERYRYKLFRYMEKHDLRSREKYDPWDDLDFPRECVRPQWTFEMYPACNLVHDIPYDRSSDHPLHGYDLEYLGSGAFREAILFNPPVYSSSSATSTSHGNPPFVIKSKIDERDLDRRDLHKINTEALIFEKLSASRVTSNMYAHCGSSIVVEAAVSITEDIIPKVRINNKSYRGYMKQSVLDTLQQNDVYPMNRFTNEEKLDIAIAMAESLAEMHGFVGSVITNDDISLDQWLRPLDGRSPAVLNDFNDAIFMEWNPKKQEYCKYWRSFGGTFKAPEEYDGDFLDESVDIWPMGNLIFTLLTGLKPYYYIDTTSEDIQEATKRGPPYIDPRYKTRSFIEGRMVEIMEQCHKLNATERVDIFQVVRHLRETKAMAAEQSNNKKT